MSKMTPSIVWLRRDLRLYDHAPLARALQQGQPILPIFVFDTDILARFHNRKDHRLAFIADALCAIHTELAQHKGGVIVMHGHSQKVVPKVAETLHAMRIICGADWEPASKRRDQAVQQAVKCEFDAVCDHLILPPDSIVNKSGEPYKVFTPYSNMWRERVNAKDFAERPVSLNAETVMNWDVAARSLRAAGMQMLDPAKGAKAMLDAVGYDYAPHPAWPLTDARSRLHHFIEEQVGTYSQTRNFMAENGTSRISPYLRFGVLSIRECARLCVERANHQTWLKELIWREFYAMILHHFPKTPMQEFQEKYHGMAWRSDDAQLQAWKNGKTGYPVVDAAMRQLLEMGWMHNRARMIAASFLTKHLLIDWREGEEHFAQYLMDYDLASNVGGWQWAASTGTDAQPYFRIFNPTTQSKRFDAGGEYIKQWVPELRHVPEKHIHAPAQTLFKPDHYPKPIVDHKAARERALAHFKKT